MEILHLRNIKKQLVLRINKDNTEQILQQQKELEKIKKHNEKLADMLFEGKITDKYFEHKTNMFQD